MIPLYGEVRGYFCGWVKIIAIFNFLKGIIISQYLTDPLILKKYGRGKL